MEAIKAKKEKPARPKYGMGQNSAFMVKLAWGVAKSVLFLCAAEVVLGVLTQVLGLYFTPTVLKALEAGAGLEALFGVILKFAPALMLVGGLNAYVETNTLFGRVDVRSRIVAQIIEKAMRTSYPNTESQSFLKQLDKAYATTGGNADAGEAIWNTLRDIGKNLIGFSIYLALLSSLDPMVLLVTLMTTVTGYFVSRRINEWDYRHREEEAGYTQKISYLNGVAGKLAFAKDIRIFGMKEWLTGLCDSTFGLYRAFRARGERMYLWANVIDVALSFLRNGIAYAYLISLTLKTDLSASQFLLYFAAVGGFTAWVEGILSSFLTLHRQSTELSAMRELLDYDEPFLFEEGKSLQPDLSKAYTLALKNVSFRYAGAEKDALCKIDITLRPGEKLAVVGLNGAGKTTLVKLLCGFYDPTEGEVLLNGENIKAFNRRDYYLFFSAVFQDFSLLAETVAVNIAQTAGEPDMERVRKCAAQAGLLEKINNLPQGFDTPLCREVFEDAPEFSGGETQKLMLARALYKNAPMLVLDEPTAALDPIAESELYQKYSALSSGKTSVFISHRLASTRFCDRILFLENGGIAEEGTHEALMQKEGGYAALFALQSRYYKEGESCHEAE